MPIHVDIAKPNSPNYRCKEVLGFTCIRVILDFSAKRESYFLCAAFIGPRSTQPTHYSKLNPLTLPNLLQTAHIRL
jgi:hypothetical protein